MKPMKINKKKTKKEKLKITLNIVVNLFNTKISSHEYTSQSEQKNNTHTTDK